MEVVINGEAREVAEGATVAETLARLGITDTQGVAVELDGRFVERDDYAAVTLSRGAVMEIIRFVGGG